MVYILIVLISYGLTWTAIYAKQCDPANHICSGRCPDVPPGIKLPDGVSICMKDSKERACVCWLQSHTAHVDSLFLCDALANGTVAQILCHTPSHCFPPDSEPTCLVIPYCDCLLMNDDGSSLQVGGWKPVKAMVKLSEHSDKYPEDDVREFSLRHLLFLLGFVIAPLLCWCILNFINEGKCKRKIIATRAAVPVNRRRSSARTLIRTDREESNALTTVTTTVDGNMSCTTASSRQQTFLTEGSVAANVALHSIVTPAAAAAVIKYENPPPYEEAINHELPQEEGGPPPAYEDVIQERHGSVQLWQTVFLIHSGSCDNV